ncbi:MAG: hypothetical protein ACOX6V_01290 [Patescibacteria group bacterium]|jgi:hypothetical protein
MNGSDYFGYREHSYFGRSSESNGLENVSSYYMSEAEDQIKEYENKAELNKNTNNLSSKEALV